MIIKKIEQSPVTTDDIKLYKENASTFTPNPTYTAFYHSHPPALQRIEKLMED